MNHPNSVHGGMVRLNAKFVADTLLYLFSHFESDDRTGHMLTQGHLLPPLTSTVKSSLFTHCIPVHSPWLPGHIDIVQTVPVVLTMAGLFPGRPCIYLLPNKDFKKCFLTKKSDGRQEGWRRGLVEK